MNRQSTSVSLVLNRGDGWPSGVLDLPCGLNPRARRRSYDGDGDLDIVAVNFNGHSISLLRNTGTTLVSDGEFQAGMSPVALATLDLDRNGVEDLCVASYEDRTVSVIRNLRASSVGVGTLHGAAFALGPAFPNPARGMVSLAFSLPGPSP